MNSKSLELTHRVLTGIDEAYWQWDLIDDHVFYSAQLMTLLGYSNEQQITSSSLWEQHVDSHSLEEVHEQIQQHIKGCSERVDITLKITNNDAKQLWLHVVGKVVEWTDDKASLMFGTVKDVTDTKSMICLLYTSPSPRD